MRTTLVLVLALLGCGDGGNKTLDAATVALDCTTYCSEVMTNCTSATTKQYDSNGDCMAACTRFQTNLGTLADTTGPTLGCRVYHAGMPSMSTPETHCVHAGPGGADNATANNSVCGSACDNFCTLAVSACPSVYADVTTCKATCAGFALGTKFNSSIRSGNTLACRLYHVTAALTAPTPHCMHIGQTPASGCN